LWRAFIKENRDRFKQVFVVFTETHQGEDYTAFVQADLSPYRVTCFNNSEITHGQDWRDVAVNLALSLCEAEFVWFTEQDLFITQDSFFTDVALKSITYDVIGYKEGDGDNRLHPSNLWVNLETLRRTNCNFGVVDNKYDHFGLFCKELDNLCVPTYQYPYPNPMFYHMNGLSHNMSLLERGEIITYHPTQFRGYLATCLQQPNLDPRFKKLAQKGVDLLLEAGL
jgi:hypothetical protein